jgi:biopolymer transport protein ExbD
MRVVHRKFDNKQRGDQLMTPLIDVVFLLLIFFVCTASFQIAEFSLPTNLAVAGAVEVPVEPPTEQPLERIVIKLQGGAGAVAWLVNERPYATVDGVRQVLAALAQVDASLPVVLDSAGEVPLGDVIDTYDICRLSGFATVQFATSVDSL